MVLVLDTLPRKAAAALLAGAATAALALVLWSYYRADSYAREGTREHLLRAIALQPDNAELHNRLGRLLLYSPLDDSNGQMEELGRAVSLDPRNGSYWVDLAVARELRGDFPGAARALESARRAEPRTPLIVWYEANFWLRRSQNARSLALLRELLFQAPEYTKRALPVFVRVTDERTLIDKVVPLRLEALVGVLEFLNVENNTTDAQRAWERILELGEPLPGGWNTRIIDWLIEYGDAELAQRVWAESARRGWIAADGASLDQPIYNGDFQRALLNYGFDWRVQSHPEASVWIEARGPEPGQQSLCVQFSDAARSGYAHVYHYIPVEPNFHYALRGAMRSERLVSRVGAYLSVMEKTPGGPGRWNTEPVVGTGGWKQVATQIETGSQTHMVLLSLVRPAPNAGEAPASGLMCMAALDWKALGPSKKPDLEKAGN